MTKVLYYNTTAKFLLSFKKIGGYMYIETSQNIIPGPFKKIGGYMYTETSQNVIPDPLKKIGGYMYIETSQNIIPGTNNLTLSH